MRDDTRRDIRLGDLDSLEPGVTASREPGLSATEHLASSRHVPLIAMGPAATEADTGGLRAPAGTPGPRARVIPAMWLALVLLLGFCGYLLYAQQQLAVTLAALDARSQASVEHLASEVSSTSSSLQDRDDEVRQSLRSLALQARKLEQALAVLEKPVADAARLQAANQAETKMLGAEMDRVGKARQQADARQEARLKALDDGLDAQAARQKALADSVARLERGSTELARLRNELSLLGAELHEAREEHDRRLRASEQATASNDTFRRQINATLDRLNQQVSELYQRR